ncbi:DNA translocase FtsK [Ketobacter nezhaii]|uniref:DNA translocase FtsK n=1 Tax=Ketobacter sp. MCCC 1A13808 TaxID=2602738 RepID=UPI00272E3F15|nr:DNA translocase FtsK [Ketobacter sp. MCCC 1A13808]
MKKAQTQRQTPPAPWIEVLVKGVREGAMIVLFFLSIYLIIALISFDLQDPGWSSLGSGRSVHNLGGRAGAWSADVLMSLFGYLAYLFPLLIAYRAWLVFRDAGKPWNWLLAGLRLLGFIMTMVAATGLAYIHFDVVDGTLPHIDSAGRNSAGGILGIEVGGAALHALNALGSTLLLLALFLIGLTIFTDVSWIKVIDGTGKLTLGFIDFLANLRSRWQQSRDAKEDVVSRREQAKAAKAQEKAAKKAQKERHAALKKEQAQQEKRKAPVIALPKPKKVEKSARAERERQKSLFDNPVSGELPAIALLDAADKQNNRGYSTETLEGMSRLLEIKLRDFNVEAEVENVLPGPVITRFEIQPAAGVKVSRITNLAKDLARSLAVISVRVVEVIPGKTVVGIEIPNEDREMIRLSEVVSSSQYDEVSSPLALALGKDISGEPVIADLQKMPHLLVAGTTGSGKSVGLNAMLISMLFKATPDELRLIMIDPKMLELSVYDNIPHLLTPVVTDMKEASNALRWCVAEMERRYRLMAAMGVRNLAGFNKKVKDAIKAGEPIDDPLFKPDLDCQEPEQLEVLPFIVVVVDEFADMMMIVGKKVEEQIARIAQKARAAGIHLILATQRPSVDVITGLIKANVPTRMAFQVSSKVDSRTILDQGGAEQLLGHGDMLYLPPGTGLPVRVHGAFVADEEVHRVCDDWRRRGQPNYLSEILEGNHEAGPAPGDEAAGGGDSESDPLYDQAVAFVLESRRASISSVQRKLKIGYNRAARMIEAMEDAGVVTEMGTNGQREVIAPSSR